MYLDIELAANQSSLVEFDASHNAFVYLYEGNAQIQDKPLSTLDFAVLNQGANVTIKANNESAKLILVAAKPLGEPIIQYGPFVMNTREEVMQAMQDYQAGVLVQES